MEISLYLPQYLNVHLNVPSFSVIVQGVFLETLFSS